MRCVLRLAEGHVTRESPDRVVFHIAESGRAAVDDGYDGRGKIVDKNMQGIPGMRVYIPGWSVRV